MNVKQNKTEVIENTFSISLKLSTIAMLKQRAAELGIGHCTLGRLLIEMGLGLRTELDTDVIGMFLDSCCVLATDEKTSVRLVYEVYVKWASNEGEAILKQRRFSDKLTERGLQRVKIGKRWWWIGIGIKI